MFTLTFITSALAGESDAGFLQETFTVRAAASGEVYQLSDTHALRFRRMTDACAVDLSHRCWNVTTGLIINMFIDR